ncbi:MAG: hypothetical protein IPJ03_06420 [Ignavibacteriales bacterium]|nr:hypothetical protein [Ignavibacteriales bacterium]
MFKLNFYKIVILLAAGSIFSGCYTQFAMYDGSQKQVRPPTDEDIYYTEESDTNYSEDYYTNKDSLSDYSGEDESYFENDYYLDYPSYHRYYGYYYPSFSIGFSYGYPYYNPYFWDPFFSPYCYTPYVYYPYPYYYYDYWNGYPYYSYGNNYSHYYGNYSSNYKYRDNNRYSLRNSSGLRNSYTTRDPLSRNTLSRDGDFSKINNNKDRDVLTVSSNNNSRGTSNIIPNKKSARVDETKKTIRTQTNTKSPIKKDFNEVKTNEPKTISKNPNIINRDPLIKKGNTDTKEVDRSKGNQTPKIKNDVRNIPPKVNGTEKKTYQSPKNYNPPKNNYKPPTKNNTPPTKSYNPPTRNYSPPTKTYSPPTRTYSPPPRTSGNNSGNNTRKNTR